MKAVNDTVANANHLPTLVPQTEGGQQEGRWYWVAATYKSVHVGLARKRHLWQRIVFLIRASNEDDAANTARQVALEKEHEYLVQGGQTLRWIFQEIEQIHELFDREVGQGTEVYWEFFERVDGAARAPRGARQRGLKPQGA